MSMSLSLYLSDVNVTPGFTTSLLLHAPCFLRLGTAPCIEVRDLATGDVIKTITDNYFSSLRSNGRFLAAPESQVSCH